MNINHDMDLLMVVQSFRCMACKDGLNEGSLLGTHHNEYYAESSI